MIKIFHLQENVPEYGAWSVDELADYWASVEDGTYSISMFTKFKKQLDDLPLGVVQIVNDKQVVKVYQNHILPRAS